jgi:hypothetical protein
MTWWTKSALALWALLWLLVLPLAAQTATPASRFAFDQVAPDLATANSYTYRYYADGATTGVALTVTCTGTASPFLCTAPVPAFTPGSHSVTLTAGNTAGESPKSVPFSFTMVIIPAVPANIRIQ